MSRRHIVAIVFVHFMSARMTSRALNVHKKSVLELKAPESRIRDAVVSGFNVTRKPIFESRISSDRDDQVVPAVELIQRRLVLPLLVGLEELLVRFAGVGIQYADFGSTGGNIGNLELD